MKIPNWGERGKFLSVSLARIVSEDSQQLWAAPLTLFKSSKDS